VLLKNTEMSATFTSLVTGSAGKAVDLPLSDSSTDEMLKTRWIPWTVHCWTAEKLDVKWLATEDRQNLTDVDQPLDEVVVTGPGLDPGPEVAVIVAEEGDRGAGPTADLTVAAGATVVAAAGVLPIGRTEAALDQNRVQEVHFSKMKTEIEQIRTLLVPVTAVSVIRC